MTAFRHDAFISHASEDKVQFVEGLANELIKLGLDIWYDAFSLDVGDSLHESIERGLAESAFGIVIFSPNFFAKNWTKAELSGLFARQMGGTKVILPVWHNVSSKELLERYPILADVVAVDTVVGVPAVAKKLVKVIRPELLTIDESRRAVRLSNMRLTQAVQQRHPGYSITVITGDPQVGFPPPAASVVASVTQEEIRTDISVVDPSKIDGGSPRITLSFRGDGLTKMQEALRTGKAQRFGDGEFSFIGSNVPLLSETSGSELDGGILEFQSNVSALPILDVRLDVHYQGDTRSVPLFKMRVVRAGADEVEVKLSHPQRPFSFSLTVKKSSSSGVGDLNVHTSFAGFTFQQVSDAVSLLSDLGNGGEFEIQNLADGKRLLRAKGSFAPEWIPAGLKRLIEDTAEIERHFGISIPWPSAITDEDIERVEVLTAFIKGDQVGINLRTSTISAVNDGFRSLFEQLKHAPFQTFLEPGERGQSHVSPIFGVAVPIGRWGFLTEQTVIENLQDVETKLRSAADGEEIELSYRGVGPTFVRPVPDATVLQSVPTRP